MRIKTYRFRSVPQMLEYQWDKLLLESRTAVWRNYTCRGLYKNAKCQKLSL